MASVETLPSAPPADLAPPVRPFPPTVADDADESAVLHDHGHEHDDTSTPTPIRIAPGRRVSNATDSSRHSGHSIRSSHSVHSSHTTDALPSPRSSPASATRPMPSTAGGKRPMRRNPMSNGADPNGSYPSPAMSDAGKPRGRLPDMPTSPIQDGSSGLPAFIDLNANAGPTPVSPNAPSHVRTGSYMGRGRPAIDTFAPPPNQGDMHNVMPSPYMDVMPPLSPAWSRSTWPVGSGPISSPNSSVSFGGQPPYPGPHSPSFLNQPPGNVPFIQGPVMFPPGYPMPASMPSMDQMSLTGYELLAAKLSGEVGGPPIRPMYRSFASLHHRLLLRLQYELMELENHLHMLDREEATGRQCPGGFLPASQRQEASGGGNELTEKRTDILGQIGYKLHNYNEILSSFKNIQDLPRPMPGNIHEYRDWLASARPITDDETTFLDIPDDLITFHGPPPHNGSEPPMQPLLLRQAPQSEFGWPPASPVSAASPMAKPGSAKPADAIGPIELGYVMGAMVLAFLVPVLTFVMIPSFVARMTIATLVGSGVMTFFTQSQILGHLLEGQGVSAWALGLGGYLGAMAVLAAAVS